MLPAAGGTDINAQVNIFTFQLALAPQYHPPFVCTIPRPTCPCYRCPQSVSSGRPLPPGVDPEELAGCLVEAQLALLDTLERAGGVLAALGRLAAEAAEAEAAGGQGQGQGGQGQGGQGQGGASPAVDSGRLMSRMAELQDKAERVAAALMG